MVQCANIRIKRRKLCMGDLRDVIDIVDRDQIPPLADNANHTMGITVFAQLPAAVETKTSGVEVFDGVNIASVITHNFYIVYQDGIDINQFVRFNGKYFKITAIENIDEYNMYMKLTSTERGDNTLQSNEA